MMERRTSRSLLNRRGLTLLEILLSMAVLAIVLLAIAATMTTMQNIWLSIREKTDQYRTTRLAIDTIAGRLASATLASRWERDPKATGVNDHFVLASDLHFVSGPAKQLLSSSGYTSDAVFFQGPFGEHGSDNTSAQYEHLHESLCAWGYFVEFGSDAKERPAFLQGHRELAPARLRFRLKEFRQPAHELTLFQSNGSSQTEPKLAEETSQSGLYRWFTDPLSKGNDRERRVSIVADNVLAMLLTPLNPDDSNNTFSMVAGDGIYDSRRYQWQQGSKPADDTRNRLPTVMQLTVIAMSEDGWQKLRDAEIPALAADLRGLMTGRFKDPDLLQKDLHFMEAELTKKKMPHRIFTMKIRTNG